MSISNKVSNMLVNGRRQPVGIGQDPELSWNTENAFGSVCSRIFDANGKTVWSSGALKAGQFMRIKAEAALEAYTEYRWSVETDEQVCESTFVTGAVKPGDWKTRFIFDREPHGRRARLSRRVFSVDGKASKAYLFLCAFCDCMNVIRICVNGKELPADSRFPGNGEHYVAYQTGYDVTDYIVSGKNVINVESLRGFSIVMKIRTAQNEYTVTTDPLWRFMDPEEGQYLCFGHDKAERRFRYEDYAEDRIRKEWYCAENDYEDCQSCVNPNAAEIHSPLFVYTKNINVSVGSAVYPISIEPCGEDEWRADLGGIYSGYPKFFFGNQEKTDILLCMTRTKSEREKQAAFDETKTNAPLLRYENNGEMNAPWHPVFFRYACRYIYIKHLGRKPEAGELSFVPEIPNIGERIHIYKAGGDTVAKYAEIKRTLLSGLVNQPNAELCPLHAAVKAQSAFFDMRGMMYRLLENAENSARVDGWMNGEFMGYDDDGYSPVNALFDLLIAPVTVYEDDGDIEILLKALPLMEKMFTFLNGLTDKDHVLPLFLFRDAREAEYANLAFGRSAMRLGDAYKYLGDAENSAACYERGRALLNSVSDIADYGNEEYLAAVAQAESFAKAKFGIVRCDTGWKKFEILPDSEEQTCSVGIETQNGIAIIDRHDGILELNVPDGTSAVFSGKVYGEGKHRIVL